MVMEHLHSHFSHHQHRHAHPAEAPRIVTVPCKYRAGRALGHGTYAVVKEMVQIDTGEHFAGKVINKKHMQGRESAIPNEINILKRLSRRHPNVVTLHDYFETPHNMYLITELCTGGELFERICQESAFTEHDAARIMKQIVSGVAFLHDNGVVHRDLKTENCLFRTRARDSTVAIADFGLSRIISSESNHALMTQCGTPGYMAPEMLQRRGHGRAVDMWAIGVITYFILSGMTPFERDSPRAEVEAVVRCEYAFEPVAHWCHISPAAQHFIASLLVYDPDKRMTAKQALAHPWLQGSRKMVMPPVSPSLPRVFRSVFDNKVDSVHCRDVQMAASQGCDGDNGKTVAQPQVGNGINDSGYNAHHKHSPHANGQAPRPMMSGQTLADTANCSASTSASSSHRHQQQMLAEPTTPNLSTNSVVQFPRLDQSATVGVGQENPSGGFAMKDGTVGILANSNTTSFHLNNDSAMGSEVEDDDDEDNGRSTINTAAIPQLHVEETTVVPPPEPNSSSGDLPIGSLGITLGVPAFKTKSVHGGEEIEMGSQNLIPGFSRNTHSNGRLNMNAMRLDLSKGSMAPVEERTSQMDVGWLMTPGSSAYGDTSSARSSASDFSHE